jgi:hypothetical protein
MSERLGLVGAMPLGNGRWRAQGYLHDGQVGGVKYLGTFDTEEEASAVFLREKERLELERNKAAEVEVERILAGPTYTYQGGVGRGASLNGTRFKVVEAKDAHNVVAVPVLGDGSLAFDAQRVVLMAYLREEPPSEAPKTAALTVDEAPPQRATVAPDREAMKKEVIRFVARQHGHDITFALDFLLTHGERKLFNTLAHIRGDRTFSQQIAWLRANTRIPSDLLDQLEKEALNGLFMDDEAKAAARVLPKEFGLHSEPAISWSEDDPE